MKININKWIYAELLETKNIVEKNIKNYRFDEASRAAYQFAWHSYCDWYLELAKTILFSSDRRAIKEIREVSSFIFKEILVLMHPFIPFVTEELWLKNKFNNSNKSYLMLTNWVSGKIVKDSDLKDVEKTIKIISNIRSFKNELNIKPGSFIDISLEKIDKKNKNFFKKNEVLLKKLGRISNIFDKELNKPSASLVIEANFYKVYFEESVDLKLIKENLINKQRKYEIEIDKIQSRLDNKNFVDRAPKHIVDQEKSIYNNLKNDINKISLTLKSL